MVACHRARIEGEEPPEYSWEEILEMRRQDLETVAGNGAEASLRDFYRLADPGTTADARRVAGGRPEEGAEGRGTTA
jgi:hypothetical protein